jgi:ferredoxin-NADP reductase
MMSMLEALARVRSRRDVYFFFGLRHAGDHVFKEKLNEIARQCSGLRMNIFLRAGARWRHCAPGL